MTIIPLENIHDAAERMARCDAWWERAIIDRPPVYLKVPLDNQQPPPDGKRWPNLRERWFDPQWHVQRARWNAEEHVFLGEALPFAFADLGPDQFAACYGLDITFGEDTSWAQHALEDWAEADRLRFSFASPYWQGLQRITDALLDAGKGLFYTGMPDIHAGADCLVSFRGPQNLSFDMIDHEEEVRNILPRIFEDYRAVVQAMFEKLEKHGQPHVNWSMITSSMRFYMPSNDFSCMISSEMFEDFFLPGILEECRFLERSLYHLDGPQALRHLDALLAIPELDAIQWVYGDGGGNATDWIEVYQRIQRAGKAMQILHVKPDELPVLMENLKPEGVYLHMTGVDTVAEADAVLQTVSRWT